MKYETEEKILAQARAIARTRIIRGGEITAPGDVKDLLRGYNHEVFLAVFLDARHRVIAIEELFYGSLTGAAVYVGQVVRKALLKNAAALTVAHNHPSGVAEPSSADRELTERLRQALALVEIRLLDHVVVTCFEHVSFAERGWL